MKILFLINSLKFGGAERMFVKTMNEFSRRGHYVYVGLFLGGEQDEGFSEELKILSSNIFYPNAKAFYDFGALIRLRKFIIQNNIDVVYSTLDESNIAARLLKIICPGIRAVIREANVAGPKPIKFKFLDALLNLFVNRIVCVSEEVKISLLEYIPFYKSKMEVLPNGIDVPENRKDYFGLENIIKILNIGSLTPKKGQKFLIEACGILEKQRPNSFLLSIVGGGAEETALKLLAEKEGITGKVSFLGKLSSAEVSMQYLNADLFILSSLWEGSPNVLLEAMVHGLACISTEVSGARGMIEDRVSGLLVPKSDSKSLAEAILSLIKNKRTLSQYGLQARNRIIEKFSFSVYIDKLERILMAKVYY